MLHFQKLVKFYFFCVAWEMPKFHNFYTIFANKIELLCNVLYVLAEKCTLFTWFLLTKHQIGLNFFKFSFLILVSECLTFIFVQRFSFLHKNRPQKPQKANELLIKYSNAAIFITLGNSALLGACRTNLNWDFNILKTDPYLWAFCH